MIAVGRQVANPQVIFTLFSASWCGFCTQAKAYLRIKGIVFRELDIDTLDSGRAYFEAGGQRGVPLIIADGKRLSGFSSAGYDHFFAAGKSRLGVIAV